MEVDHSSLLSEDLYCALGEPLALSWHLYLFGLIPITAPPGLHHYSSRFVGTASPMLVI